MPKLHFEAPKGRRVKSGHFRGVMVRAPGGNGNLWWCRSTRQWLDWPPIGYDGTSCAPCNSVRAFKRMLKKHPRIQNSAVLVSWYENHDVYASADARKAWSQQ